MKRNLIFATLIAALLLCGCKQSGVFVKDTLVENQKNPIAIGIKNPKFSWKISTGKNAVEQESYRILVASDEAKLKKNEGDLWDSGEVQSGNSQYVVYAGKDLSSRQKAYWKVFIKTNVGEAESDPATFSMALLNDSDWQAKWIGHTSPDDVLSGHTSLPARYLRKEFKVKGKVERATLYISGLGTCVASVNGVDLGVDQVLSPTVSDYSKTVYYNTYDVTKEITSGNNALAVELGSGRYTSMRIPGMYHYDIPKLLCQLEVVYKGGKTDVVVSDETWKISTQGPIRKNNEFDGETYDASKEFNGWKKTGFKDSDWEDADIIAAPGGVLVAQPNPNIAIQERLHPVSVTPKDDSYIVDMGQNMVGWLQIKGQGQAGDTIKMVFAETLNPDGSLYLANLRSAEVTDRYIVKDDKPFTWHPTFTYHGFRYVQISGMRNQPGTADLEGQVFYDKMPVTGSFECSNDVMNQVYKNAYWGIRGNYRGMPTDCPQRDERLGWTGDRTTGVYGESLIFGNHDLYSKWLRDVEETMTEEGGLSNVCPAYWQVYNDNMTWPGVLITAADMLRMRFGDEQAIIDHYPAMKKWLAYMSSKYGDNGIITKDTYGDWCMPPESQELIHSKDPSRITDGAVLSTTFYYYLCDKMAMFAPIAGQPNDVQFFKAEMEKTSKAFNDKYYDEEKGYYSNGTVTANILPLFFGMVPKENQQKVFNHIVEKTEGEFGGHVSTGVVGIETLMRGLTEYGAPELALKIASNDTYPSWGYMAKHGATTIWELWNGDTADPAMNSGNHVMLLGDLVTWEYEYLGGIRSLEPGYKVIGLKPYPVEGLDWVNCSYDSPYGHISSQWKKEGNKFVWDFTIPANTTAKVYIPGEVNADAVEKAGGVAAGEEGDRSVYTFKSGSYSLTTTL